MPRLTPVAFLLSIAPLPVAAHNVSMSTSRLDVHGERATLEIRVPSYEARHVADPPRTIPAAIQIDGTQPASAACAEESGSYVCRSEYVVAGSGPLRVHCTLARVIVSNHIHVMHATRAGRIDQAVFEASLEDAILQFRTAGPVESAVRSRPQMIGVVLVAMLAAGILAASLRDSVWVCGAFFLSAGLMSLVGPLPWQLTPGFLEAAVAVVAAYMSFEVIALESSAWRVAAAAAMGMAFGRYALALAGAASPAAMLAAGVACFAFGIAWISRRFPRVRTVLAWIVLAAALLWVAGTLLG